MGAVVGFSADRVLRRDDSSISARRQALYDDLKLASAQRAALDSLFDARNCRYDSIFKPIQPALDTLKLDTRARMNAILTPEQRTRLDARRRDDDARREAERQRIQASCR